jgi:hypothetical protein
MSAGDKIGLFIFVGLIEWLIVVNLMHWCKPDWIAHNTLACVAVVGIPIITVLLAYFITWVTIHFIEKSEERKKYTFNQ